ncbi:hypothetical protein PRK78_005734 [Emydomyces testavorans]|uniref:Cytochrome P450 monooxygenase n=1 Tax=Emydomyces testavorans TaxID=2070801 RepID=A0AAF0DK62_9EURO|nr:hypothetical protein PRK78_005734 [Emydomyces testavorans]
MLSLAVIGISIVALVAIYKYLIVPVVLSPLSKIPNAHFSVPVLPLWMWWKRRKGVQNQTIRALHQKLGPIVRLGPWEISVNSANGLRTIYVSGAFEKTSWYRDLFQNYNVSNLVSMEAHEPHSIQKRMISNVYSKSYVQNSRDLAKISEIIVLEKLLPLLNDLAERHAPVNVLSLNKGIGMDFTTAYLFGVENGTNFVSDSDYRDRWLDNYEQFKQQLPKDRAFGPIEQWCLDLCKAAEAYSSGRKVALSEKSTPPVVHRQLWESIRRQKRPQPADASIVVASEMLDHIVAGHETTGITMTYLMYEMSRCPDIMASLRGELCRLSHPIRLSQCSSSTLPSPQEIDKLPLLDAIIRETLRLYPAAPSPQPRISHSKSVVVEGYKVPNGVTVSSSAYTLHRNPDVFSDPERWIPSRWLQTETTQLKEMHRWFWAFGSGGRMCLGSNLAIQELKLVAAAVYSNFTTFIIDDEGIEQSDSPIGGPVSNKLILGFNPCCHVI